ncbi:type II secretion system protein [Rubritalea tangerina]|uniref:Type II secretion system protein n=1 Tax=Rubritalea tangerina TaxID=430798 RepID=A0ABW4ZFH9_9BACT
MKIKHKHHLRKGFSLVELLVVIAIIAGLAAVSYGPIIKQMKAAEKNNAITAARNIYTAMQSYANDNDGLFPNESTARSGENGSTAEGCFTMLINAGKIDNEEIFWNTANNSIGTTAAAKPDLNGEVDPGENAWGYVSGLSTSSRTNLPLLFDASTDIGTFDTGVWDGFAIVAKLDSSVEALRIDYTGAPLNEDGTSKQGAILEKRGGSNVDIFQEGLPAGTTVIPANGN